MGLREPCEFKRDTGPAIESSSGCRDTQEARPTMPKVRPIIEQ